MQGKPLFLCRSRVLADPNLAIGPKSWFDPDPPCTGVIRGQPDMTLSGSWELATSLLGLKRWGFLVHLYSKLALPQ